MSQFQNRDYLQKSQYRTSNHLTARADLHSRFNLSAEPWPDWVRAQLDIQPGETVLECGAGPGWLWEAPHALPADGRVVVTDLSPGMVAEAKTRLAVHGTRVAGTTADIQNLPFPAGSFDIIVANHMLYHVPNIPLSLSEATRVLRPGGRFMAATNGWGHMRELFELGEAMFPGTPMSIKVAMGTLPFALENGMELLERHFEQVELRLYESRLEVDDAEALISYMLSSAETTALVSPTERQAAVDRLQAQINAAGPVHISKETGVFLANSPREVA